MLWFLLKNPPNSSFLFMKFDLLLIKIFLVFRTLATYVLRSFDRSSPTLLSTIFFIFLNSSVYHGSELVPLFEETGTERKIVALLFKCWSHDVMCINSQRDISLPWFSREI